MMRNPIHVAHLSVDGVVVLSVIANDIMSYSQRHYHEGIIPMEIKFLLNCDDK